VVRLAGRPLLLLSARDLLQAAAAEDVLLVALVAPWVPAIEGFVRAARDAGAPLLLVRPSGAAEEKGPEEERDDRAFVDAALEAAHELRFKGPMALLKEPPRAGCAVPDAERVRREIEAGFTGLALTAGGAAAEARDAALAATAVCQYELGLEVVALGGSARAGHELAEQLRSRGAAPSAVRMTGHDAGAADAGPGAGAIAGVAISSADESSLGGLRQLVAAGPFLRALLRSAPAELLARLQAWADEKGASLEQAAARHQRLLRELSQEQQDKLEALCCFGASDLYTRAFARGTGLRLAARVGQPR
jgi:hypothetical protein